MFLLPRRRFRLGREVCGHLRLRHLARRRPLGAALGGDDEPDALHALGIVSERRVEDSALAEAHREEDRLLFAGAAELLVRVSRRQEFDVLRRAAQAVVEFVLGMEPFAR